MIEKTFPLRILVCKNCWLVQTEDFVKANELFDVNYAYFSSFSTSWLEHCARYVEDMATRFELAKNSFVVEIACNDGYLLQYVRNHGIPCLGIEPTSSTANVARSKGIEVIEDFFCANLAKKLVAQGKQADLIIANNVLAHVPNINDFVSSFSLLLLPRGVATFEFPHVMHLVEGNQFDTIYHEHFSYLSLGVAKKIFEANGLGIFDVEKLSTHGGSLRIFSQRLDKGIRACSHRVDILLNEEIQTGVFMPEYYVEMQARAEKVKKDFLVFLREAKRLNKIVAAYGAAAKGNTLMNFAGVHSDLVQFVVDLNPEKQNKFMPGSRIPIVSEDNLRNLKPHYVVVFPWNLRQEIMSRIGYIRNWGAKFVFAIPRLEIVS